MGVAPGFSGTAALGPCSVWPAAPASPGQALSPPAPCPRLALPAWPGPASASAALTEGRNRSAEPLLRAEVHWCRAPGPVGRACSSGRPSGTAAPRSPPGSGSVPLRTGVPMRNVAPASLSPIALPALFVSPAQRGASPETPGSTARRQRLPQHPRADGKGSAVGVELSYPEQLVLGRPSDHPPQL